MIVGDFHYPSGSPLYQNKASATGFGVSQAIRPPGGVIT